MLNTYGESIAHHDCQPRQSGQARASCGDCPVVAHCFSGANTQETRANFAERGRRHETFRNGQVVFQHGQPLRKIAVVRTGAVKLTTVTEDGLEQVVQFCLPGDVIGLDALANGTHETSATVLGLANLCEIPIGSLKSACSQAPDLMTALWASYAKQINARNRHILGLSQRTAESRFAEFLLILSHRMEVLGYSPREFNLPMSRQDIASYLALAVETVSRLLTGLQKDSVISVQRRLVQINSMQQLEDRVGAVHEGGRRVGRSLAYH